MVIISAGTEEELRATGFVSPVLFDPIFGAGPNSGAKGTPMAVLVDADGAIASNAAAGAEAALTLLAHTMSKWIISPVKAFGRAGDTKSE